MGYKRKNSEIHFWAPGRYASTVGLNKAQSDSCQASCRRFSIFVNDFPVVSVILYGLVINLSRNSLQQSDWQVVLGNVVD